MTEKNQIDMFTKEDAWEGMPEFVQRKQKPFGEIVVRFDTEYDMQEFSRLIDQRVTDRTKSIWHPQLVRGETSHLRYFDES